MNPTDINIQHVAKLARLTLTDEEAASYQKQLAGILDYMDALGHHDLSGVEPSAHATEIYGELRADVSRPSIPRELMMANAPRSFQDQFQIPKVIE
jgi:aspartyl-tRNA(Asn)/glutamyl-tRNA(Gln) amidotransferase subunit C